MSSSSPETGAGPLVFLPLLEPLGIVKAIAACGFPSTGPISDIPSVLAFGALKLTGGKRGSQDSRWNMDRALGLFAGLNVLPKATALSYSYRVTRQENRRLLERLSGIFQDEIEPDGEFNLDLKAIPHWGDGSESICYGPRGSINTFGFMTGAADYVTMRARCVRSFFPIMAEINRLS